MRIMVDSAKNSGLCPETHQGSSQILALQEAAKEIKWDYYLRLGRSTPPIYLSSLLLRLLILEHRGKSAITQLAVIWPGLLGVKQSAVWLIIS